MLSDLETYIVSVERLKEYTEIENEAPWERPRSKPPSEWPTQGEVEFKDYSTRLVRILSVSIAQMERANINIGSPIEEKLCTPSDERLLVSLLYCKTTVLRAS